MKSNGQQTFGKSLIKIGHKGQGEGPFELLIAVILMTFVIFIGIQAMEALRVQTCQGEAENAMEKLRTAIESSVNSNAFTQLNFNYEKCFKPPEGRPEVQIITVINLTQCQLICGGAEDSCTFARLRNERFVIDKCLNIPFITNFEGTLSACVDNSGTEFEIRNLKDTEIGIERGYYNFVPATTNQTFPVICAYKKNN